MAVLEEHFSTSTNLRGETQAERRWGKCGTRGYLRGFGPAWEGKILLPLSLANMEAPLAVLLTGKRRLFPLLGAPEKAGFDWRKVAAPLPQPFEGGAESGAFGEQDHRLLFDPTASEHGMGQGACIRFWGKNWMKLALVGLPPSCPNEVILKDVFKGPASAFPLGPDIGILKRPRIEGFLRGNSSPERDGGKTSEALVEFLPKAHCQQAEGRRIGLPEGGLESKNHPQGGL
ncbi:hypothetical protein GWK47_051919 [Chionoecetes opilio]|uniref:Uncharacterized protein n=1 Tax=Chionoecetes opilio TaxID=41210 RepID=A0A8J4Y6Z6_CHIOP|nr:hypothetical protein GWK47_051919 [Chionoecetes opilio]